MADKRSTYIPYIPGPPPTIDGDDLRRATWDELYRVAQSLIDLDRPVSCTVRQLDFTLDVDDPPVPTRLFVGGNPQWQQPEDLLDATTGIVTIQQSGLYSINVSLRIPAFDSPNSKDYYGEILTYYVPVLGVADTWADISGGVDDFPITVISTGLTPLQRGDQLYWDAGVYHEQKSGTIDVTATLQLFRVSAIR